MSKKGTSIPRSFHQWQARRKDGQTLLNFSPIAAESDTRATASTTTSRRLPICGVEVEFPFQPYPAQIQMMAKIVQALQRSENALLESPTGSGKSLALLCAALAWREHLKKEKRAVTEIKTSSAETARAPLHGKTTNVDPPPSPKRPLSTDDDDFQPIKARKTTQSFRSTGIAVEMDSKHEKDTVSENGQSNLSIPRIYIGSRTHDQIKQLVNELKTNTNYRPRMTVLGSRDNLCIHPKVSKSSNKTEECVALLESNTCTYGSSTHKLLGHPKFRVGANEVWDIEDIVQAGKKVRGCPYYATRSMYEHAEVVFCPYNYIVDPIVRKLMDINVKDNIIILDEAHNIEDTARDAGSFEVKEVELYILQKELQQIIHAKHEEAAHKTILYASVEELDMLVDSLLDWINDPNNTFDVQEFERHIHLWSGIEITNKLSALGVTGNTLETDLLPAYKCVNDLAEKVRNDSEGERVPTASGEDGTEGVTSHPGCECVSNKSLRLLEGLFMILQFLYSDRTSHVEGYRMALIKKIHRTHIIRDTEGVYKLGFWCLNPGVIFRELSESARSVLLTSGTLSPLDTFASELETDFSIRLEANHVIDPSQVWVGVIPKGPSGNIPLKGTFQNIERFQYQDDIGEALHEIVLQVPFGILCFAPSYPTLDKLVKRWKSTSLYSKIESRKRIICEPHGGTKEAFKKLVKGYFDFIKQVRQNGPVNGQDGALLFGVYRGKLSEGIDFADDSCRAVVALGIPFPNRKNIQVDLKYQYNNAQQSSRSARRLLDGNRWYEIQAYRAINQALGRCIRHQKDWGAIILLEDRFTDSRKVSGLSKWVRGRCIVHKQGFGAAMESLGSFTRRRLALDSGDGIETPSATLPNSKECHETAPRFDFKVENSLKAPLPPTEQEIRCVSPSPITHSPPLTRSSREQTKLPMQLVDDPTTQLHQRPNLASDTTPRAKVDLPDEAAQRSPAIVTKTHSMTCKHCQSVLITGPPRLDLPTARTTSLCYLTTLETTGQIYPTRDSQCRVLELVRPDEWEFHHTHGETRITDLQDTAKVHWNRTDQLCYVALAATCCGQAQDKPFGTLVCASTGSQDERVGRVLLLASAVQVQDERKDYLVRQSSDYYDDFHDVEPEELQRLYDLF